MHPGSSSNLRPSRRCGHCTPASPSQVRPAYLSVADPSWPASADLIAPYHWLVTGQPPSIGHRLLSRSQAAHRPRARPARLATASAFRLPSHFHCQADQHDAFRHPDHPCTDPKRHLARPGDDPMRDCPSSFGAGATGSPTWHGLCVVIPCTDRSPGTFDGPKADALWHVKATTLLGDTP